MLFIKLSYLSAISIKIHFFFFKFLAQLTTHIALLQILKPVLAFLGILLFLSLH